MIKLLSAAVLGLAAFSSSTAMADTFRIGLNAERTGPASSYGEHMRIAAEIALDRVNENGGVNGHMLEFVIEDNHSSPEQAVIATRNLARAGVAGILGPVQTSQVRTAFPATNREEVISVSPGSGAPGLAASNRPWGFRNAAIDQMIIDEIVAHIRSLNSDAKRVIATLDPRDAYNHFLVTGVAPSAIEANGFEFSGTSSTIEIPTDTQDFSVHVTSARAMEPDVVLLGQMFEQGLGFLREANRQKLDVPYFAGLGYITESVAEAAGPLRVYAGQPFYAGLDDEGVKAFVAEFEKRVSAELPGQYTTPTYIDAGAYETVMIFADALRESGLTPESPLEEVRASIRDYMAGLTDYAGLGNRISFNEEGDAVKPTIIFETVDGNWQIIEN